MEVIKIPRWCNFDEKYSEIISDFFREEKIESGTKEFSLDTLRDYYLKNKYKGRLLIEEMSLRGFEFPNNGSNFLPCNHNYDTYLYCNNPDCDQFLNINFALANLGYIVSKFNIKNNGFFNYIPLNGFLTLRSDAQLRILENEFVNNGFVERPIKIENQIIDIFDLESKPEINNDTDYPEITVSDYLGKKATVFNLYCKQNGIITIKELKKVGSKFIDNTPHLNYELKNYIFNRMLVVDDEGRIMDSDDFIYKVLNADTEKKHTLISDILPEKYFNLSMKLKDSGIVYVGDLYKNLENIPGVGVGKIEMIKKTIEGFIAGKIMARMNASDDREPNDYKISENIMSFKIEDFFNSMGITNFLKKCKENGYIYISDLKDINITKFINDTPGMGKEKTERLTEKLFSEKYNCEPKELLNVLYEEVKDKSDYKIILERIGNEKTLQELADEENLTRERIRQMEARSMIVIKACIDMSLPIIYSLLENSKIITFDDILKIYENESDAKIIFNTLSNDSSLYFKFENSKKLFIKDRCKKLFVCIERIKDLFQDDFIKLNEYDDQIGEILSLYGLDDVIEENELIQILLSCEYKRVGPVFVKKSTSINRIYNSLFKTFFKNGLRLDEEGCSKIREIYDKYVGVKEYKVDSDRNLIAKLTRLDENIICGNASYINIENVKADKVLIKRIKTYITQLFEEEKQTSITASKVFELFQAPLRENGVDNYMYLYGIIRYYYPDDFIYDNFWFCYNDKSKEKYSRFESFVDYLKKFDTPNKGVPIEELKNTFAISDVVIYNLTALDDISEVNFKKNLIYKEYLVLSEKLLDKILSFIDSNIDDYFGIISVKSLLQKYDIYLEQENVYDTDTLSKILSKYMTKYKIKENYIINREINEEINTEFFYYLYINNHNIITRNGLKEFGEKYALYENRVYYMMLEKFPELYQINYTDFVKEINVPRDCIESINNMLERNMIDKEYCLLSDFAKNGEIFTLPNVGYEWNEYLLRSIIEKADDISHNYILLKIPGVILFVERGIILRKELQIYDYYDFLLYLYRKRDYQVENINQLREKWLAEGVINGEIPIAVKNQILDEYGRLRR